MSLSPEQKQELAEFFGKISHQLRSPLMSIQGYADLILLAPAEDISPELRSFAESIKENCKLMQDTITEIKDHELLRRE